MKQILLQSRAQAAGIAPSRRPNSLPMLPVRMARTCPAPVRRARVAARAAPSVQEARWESQIRDGRVRNIGCQDVTSLQSEGWVLLDVRPPNEREKAPIVNAVEVPLFVPDPANDLAAFIKKATDFGMGSWWLGGTHYIANTNFLAQVQAQVPKDARVMVACQKGLRSLAACEQLARAGYQQLAWINGGLDTARKGDIPTTNGKDVRYGGIGGLSETIGWTEVQREETNSSFLGGLEGVIKIMAVILFLDMCLFAYEQVRYWQESGTGPFSG
uniref:Rhodanese domain-containing protein n=1 Tax=Chlamydomonas leiostraca TaxID=1034604 RepID=A0A7S0S0D3_9CHLO|mmetsp:Transcript_34619/g.87595  ORF Transcript_34619/g.87595 Transcript_34619/m.87595 type:complete len:272 (+) Transcript_34619:54-869(+)|eukprot:CAMPEP_0202866026 /NCGR_PEP_ID=MMETSP1391-20130828/7055_1 /ASSEMBLY_ACC=CAM_ASM_000867 /TAXON_ID=1034604 /ORGANISM="Chlamydomonas leiostraca, Strain SAG 11-49" /LENGTH=271 /DNA_ID=CAMNT_0049545931 /DNA_START=41 /DNA_END=856 /DNA_ORIENTATION=+